MSMFDVLESDDDGVITFNELAAYFQRSGAWHPTNKENERASTNDACTYVFDAGTLSFFHTNVCVRVRFCPTAGAPRSVALGQTYSLLRCLGDGADDGAGVWEEVYVGKALQRQVPGLQPGTTYAFRIQVRLMSLKSFSPTGSPSRVSLARS